MTYQYRIGTTDIPMDCYDKMARIIDDEFGGKVNCWDGIKGYDQKEHLIDCGNNREMIWFGTEYYDIMIRRFFPKDLWVLFQRKEKRGSKPKHREEQFREILKKMGYTEIRKF